MEAAVLLQEPPADFVLHLLGEIPSRWGRMPLLCRAVLVETGRLLGQLYPQKGQRSLKKRGLSVGLVGATRHGSLVTDLDFAATMAPGPEFASPALFGYTLANMPLAEAAVHFGLTGPVYALFTENDLLTTALAEARTWLAQDNSLSLMLACGFDHEPGPGEGRLRVSVLAVNPTTK